jgi:hypothetical protein
MSKTRLYEEADICLLPEARRGIRLPLRSTIATPVQFDNHPGEYWSMWIVPAESLYPSKWGHAKVAVGMQEYASSLMAVGVRFSIWFGGVRGGEGVIRQVVECDEAQYDEIFRFSGINS